ncbi:YopX family protein [Lactiplantibacillus plantarum]|uniref:YopX family protein n=1 Tax=Lactiplantibacillus plantarum TaxID=1590 RepID=UPI003B9FC2DE
MIKFRAWDNECKVIRGYDELKGLTFDALDASDFKIEQFTGLKGVNGKEIYEGDILEYYYETHGQTFYDPDTLGAIGGEPGIETDVIGKVAIWPSTGVVLTRIKAEYPEDFDSSNFDVPKMLHVNKRFTIIGNVHDNPELLEADK